MTVAAGTRLGGRYELLDLIATGGMGHVWRARDDVLQRDVAVKVLVGATGDPHSAERFRREARHAAGLSHPGIASVYDFGEADGTAYLVMELVDGEPLSSLLAREHRLSPSRTMDVVGQAALALQAAHAAGVVHRDVKPGNLLVRPDGVVKVTDFGIARSVGTATLTAAGSLVGTAAYLSPEQAEGAPATPLSDLYALGIVAYECLAGRPPFDGATPAELALARIRQPPPPLDATVPQPVAALVTGLLAKDPRERPQDAGDVGRTALALAAAPASVSVPARTRVMPVPAGPRDEAPGYDDADRRRTRNRLILVGLAVVLIGVVILKACSGGPVAATVPKLTGGSYADAVAALHHAVLDAKRHPVTSRQPAGTVVAQSPAPGARLKAGSTVTLSVSTGPASTPAPAPTGGPAAPAPAPAAPPGHAHVPPGHQPGHGHGPKPGKGGEPGGD